MTSNFIVLTIFPELVQPCFQHGIVRRAVQAGLVKCEAVDLRDYTSDKHRSTDDSPYGGGPGMVMLCEPVFLAVEEMRAKHGRLPLILLSPGGIPLTHDLSSALARWVSGEESAWLKADSSQAFSRGLMLLCGRYEGVDQRVIESLVDLEVSLGDFVLSGGEIAAMALLDAVIRLLPGSLGNQESVREESFATGLLDWPHYTRPEEFRGLRVPEVLLSGDHARILAWRKEEALLATLRMRPDLLDGELLAKAQGILKSRELNNPSAE